MAKDLDVVARSSATRRPCAPGSRELAERTGADELMITTMVHGQADRLESYRLVAREFSLVSS